MSKIKIKFGVLSNFELGLRLTLYGALIIISVSFFFSLWFLYQRFYLTLTQTGEIIILKSELSVENLNVGLYQKIKKQNSVLVNKELYKWEEVKNPFQPL